MIKKLSYDPAKRDKTLKERGLDFERAAEVFDSDQYTFEDTRFDYGETRNITVGYLAARMMVVVWMPRDETRHVISMRKANRYEQEYYQDKTKETMARS